MGRSDHDEQDGIGHDAELIASLFATRVPAAIITLLFLMVGVIAARDAADPPLRTLVVAGMIASVIRLSSMTAGKRRLAQPAAALPPLRTIERRFAITYLTFAAILGAFCARAMVVLPTPLLLLIGILMTGYAAGVAAGVTLRPRIAVSAIGLAVLPATAVMAARLDTPGVATAVMLVAFLAGGLRSMQMRFRSETGRITLRRTYERLAQRDYLTRIANRLGLEEGYAAVARATPGDRVVVHYLDLDEFKQVNDLHGHDVGDALLIAVAARLTAESGHGIAARLGGDEFVLMHFGEAAESSRQALHLLERRLSLPYDVDGGTCEIGVSVGAAIGTTDDLLHDLLRDADMHQRLRKLERRRDNRPVQRPVESGAGHEWGSGRRM